MISDLFMCWLSVSFLEKCLHIFCPSFNWSVCLMLSYTSSLHILDINPLLDISFANIFYPVGGLFIVDSFYHCAKAFQLAVVPFVFIFLA